MVPNSQGEEFFLFLNKNVEKNPKKLYMNKINFIAFLSLSLGFFYFPSFRLAFCGPFVHMNYDRRNNIIIMWSFFFLSFPNIMMVKYRN